MAIVIYTYSNPYKIDKEPYWALIKNSFHLCASQTLVNGLCDQYKEFYKGKLTTIKRFISTLFYDWESDSVNISQRAFIDNMIEYMSFLEYADDELGEEDIKASLKRNRGYILQSVRIMFELGMDPDNIRMDCLSEEQRCVVGLYKEIIASNSPLFALRNDFSEDEVEHAVSKTIRDALSDKSKTCSDINVENVVVHGIHQFTPIMLRTIEVLSKYKNVIILFNYQEDYKNVYQTWLNIYSLFESKVNLPAQNFNNESQNNAGGIIADNMAAMTAGSTAAIDLSRRIEVTEFDNQTEFAGYIAKKFEEASIERAADGFKHPALTYMDEQIYAANSDVNEILKIYFPEQFGERDFLDYPIGHFFISITNMWDPESNSMRIKDDNDIVECLSCGIIDEKYRGSLVSIFDRCQLFISEENTLVEIIDKLRDLEDLLDSDEDEMDLKRLDYFNVTEDELDELIAALEALNVIADQFFADFSEHQSDFNKFYKKIADLLENQVLEREDLDEDFKDIIIRVLARLKEVNSIQAKASFDCLIESMQLYLKQIPAPEASANWIVRNFEQIDGDVLRKTSTKRNKTYHFACLSDQDMNVTRRNELPWPLDIGFFEVAQAPVDWKYQVYVTSRLEYRNFNRYALVYGLGFSKCDIKLSYIKNENNTENDLYYLLRVLNAEIKPYVPAEVSNYRKIASGIEVENPIERRFTQYDLMKYRLCKYRFLLDSIVEDTSVYKDAFLMRLYLKIVLENRAKKRFSGQRYTKKFVRNYLEEQMDELEDEFPFISQMDCIDVVNEAQYYVSRYAAKTGKFPVLRPADYEFMTMREEFLKIPTRKDDDTEFQKIFDRFSQNDVDYMFSNIDFEGERFRKTFNRLCDSCADKEVCIDIYSVKRK